jgi:hypothetical protein
MGTRELDVVRAVAAAAAYNDPSGAFRIVTQARDDPSSVLDPTDEERILLGIVLSAVVRARDDRSRSASASEELALVAAAAGADARLAAVADAALEGNDPAVSAALEWAASLEPNMLERAAKAAARVEQLELVPDPETRLDLLEVRVANLEKAGGGGVVTAVPKSSAAKRPRAKSRRGRGVGKKATTRRRTSTSRPPGT